MCQSKSEGGQRCEYADILATVRRKAARKHKDVAGSRRQHLIEDDVRAWKDENKEIVTAHLPERKPFQVKPGKKPVPEELVQMLSAKRTEPITGFPEDQRLEHTKKLCEEFEAWDAELSNDEGNAIKHYTMTGFESVNTYLRRSGFAQWKKENPWMARPSDGQTAESWVKNRVANIDSALEKAPRPEGPRKLYRFFRVPAGVTPSEYIDRYFKTGEGFKDSGYMSTTADPEFILAHMKDRNKGVKNKGYVVMEILSKKGASLQPDEESRAGDVQSLEKEVLLPRNTKFRIMDTRKSQKFAFASDRDDLHNHYHRTDYWTDHYREGDEMRFPVIQLVDEDLIDEHHRNAKKKQ